MLAYAVQLQKIIVLKNFVCGWLAVSPLLGASFIDSELVPIETVNKLWRLAAVGFPMQVSREILKDIEDIDSDYGTKQTLPILLGEKAAHFIAYTIVAINTATLIVSPAYRKMFSCRLPFFPIGLVISTIMSIKSSFMSLEDGQKTLKKSIFIILTSMIASLSLSS